MGAHLGTGGEITDNILWGNFFTRTLNHMADCSLLFLCTHDELFFFALCVCVLDEYVTYCQSVSVCVMIVLLVYVNVFMIPFAADG